MEPQPTNKDIELKLKYDEEDVVFNPDVRIDSISGLVPTLLSATPAHTPRNFSEQVVLYKSGTTYRLYIYDAVNGAWRYVALT